MNKFLSLNYIIKLFIKKFLIREKVEFIIFLHHL